MLKSRLRGHPGFVALYLVQFCGALNDNLFRAALITLIAFRFSDSANQAAQWNNLALVLFILPMILISPLAGQLADRGDKPLMVRRNKWFEMSISAIALLGLWLVNLPLCLFALMLLGVQSALFGPNKYALIPQLIPGFLLARGNAAVASGTFIAISLGTIAGTWLVSSSTYFWIAGLAMLAVSGLGLIAAYRLPSVERGDRELSLDKNLFRAARKGLVLARQDKLIGSAIIGLSWFWFFGTGFMTQLPTWSRYLLGPDSSNLSWLYSSIILGLLAGAILAGRSGRGRLETGTILPNLLALIVFALIFSLLPLGVHQPAAGSSPAKLAEALTLLFLTGLIGGAFLVPLYALLQQRASLKERARIIAANNLINSVFMVASAALGALVFSLVEPGLVTYYALLALSGLPLLYVLRAHAQPAWRLVGLVISHLLYRIRYQGRELIPPQGPLLLFCNHLSYADSIILFGAIERPTRFIMDDKYWRIPLFNPVLRSARTIPICSPLSDRKQFDRAIDEAAIALEQGEAVFIFPEGRLSPEGQTISFKRGVERILARQPATLQPVAISGLWGSWFSHGGRPALTGWPKPGRRTVVVRFGEPYESDDPNATEMRDRVIHLLEQIAQD